MSILDALTMGESSRIDYVIREYEKLEQRVARLTKILISKGILDQDDAARILETHDGR